jgi:hypothetical protein
MSSFQAYLKSTIPKAPIPVPAPTPDSVSNTTFNLDDTAIFINGDISIPDDVAASSTTDIRSEINDGKSDSKTEGESEISSDRKSDTKSESDPNSDADSLNDADSWDNTFSNNTDSETDEEEEGENKEEEEGEDEEEEEEENPVHWYLAETLDSWTAEEGVNSDGNYSDFIDGDSGYNYSGWY